MLTHRLTIEKHEYLLDPAMDVDALQLEICDAMRRGGGIVSFETSTNRPYTAIVSPGVPVIFESIAVPDHDDSVDVLADPMGESFLEDY